MNDEEPDDRGATDVSDAGGESDFATGFPPVSRPDARVLVLGSMPGRDSLRAASYYAHPRNAFWPIMAGLFAFELPADFPGRYAQLMTRRVALWDVLKHCERPGSLDSAIVERTAEVNDFAQFLETHPGVHSIFFNGAKAEQLFRRRVWPGLASRELELVRLPSTSPAHAGMRFEHKLDAWRPLAKAVGTGA